MPKTIASFAASFAAVLAVTAALGAAPAWAQEDADMMMLEDAAPAMEAPSAPALQAEEQQAEEKDSPPEAAEALAKKAAQYVKDHGAETALAAFNRKNGEFIHDDLYVWAIDEIGTFTAHPANPALVGTNQMEMKDIDGTPLVKHFAEVARGDERWVSYKWPHPISKKIRPQKSYVINVDGVILGVGAYLNESE